MFAAHAMEGLHTLTFVAGAGVEVLRIPIIDIIKTQTDGTNRAGLQGPVAKSQTKITWMLPSAYQSCETSSETIEEFGACVFDGTGKTLEELGVPVVE